MRVLRFRFLSSSRAGAARDAGPNTDGLDAFGSEQEPAVADAAASLDSSRGFVWATCILMVAVLLEAYPTALWLMERFQPVAAAASVDLPAPVSGLPALATVPPCEPGPAPTAAATTAAVAGRTSSLDGAAAETPTARTRSMLAGVLAVMAPVPMRVYERGRLIGSTEAESMMLPVGHHDLEFVNENVGYRVRRSVTVEAGQRSTIRLEAPMGTLHVNAVPWAEVWIDDEPVGETPIGNLQARIGNRQLVFRHPELGERRTTVLVTLVAPARISMDLRNK